MEWTDTDLKCISVMRLEPGDILVYESQLRMSEDQRNTVGKTLNALLTKARVNGVSVAVLECGAKLSVIRGGEA